MTKKEELEYEAWKEAEREKAAVRRKELRVVGGRPAAGTKESKRHPDEPLRVI